jgi:hypothetical protein
MGSCCGCLADSVPAARKPSQRVPAPPRLNPLEVANRGPYADKSTSYSTLSSDSEGEEGDGSGRGSSSTSGRASPSSSSSTSSPEKTSSSFSSSSSSNSNPSRSSSRTSFESVDVLSVESDPQERARRAAESFLQWKNKEYVPLSADEKRAIKEYRKAVAQEEGTYMSTRAQRPRPDAPRREKTREGDYIPLDDPAENYALKRRHSQIRFTEAVAAPAAADVHNEAVLVPLDDGVAIPALKPTASILSKSSLTDVVDDVPLFDDATYVDTPTSDSPHL